MKRLIMLGRPGCGLCEDWEEALHQAFPGQFLLDWRDVDRSPEWRKTYGTQIPVLLDESGQLLARDSLDLPSIERYLAVV